MIPAEAKKKENIAEYIIHMYQTEDLILTYQFNLNDILEYVIKHMSDDEATLKKLLLWYADIIDQMQIEKITDSSKRLTSTQYYVDRLSGLHESLVGSDQNYIALCNKAEKDINKHRELSENTITNPVQICLNGLYGMLLLKLNGKKITKDQKSTLADFGAILAYLSNEYMQNSASK